MTEKDVKQAISEIEVPVTLKDDVKKAVNSARPNRFSYRQKRLAFIAGVLVICLAVTGKAISGFTPKNYVNVAIATAADIEKTTYIDYNKNIRKNNLSVDASVTNKALLSMSSEALKDAEGNTVFSPMAVYMCLGMLQEMADGETKKQILDFVGMDESGVREAYKSYYKVLCLNTDDAHLKMNSSAWFNNLRGYNGQTVSNMAEYYYADVFNANFQKSATKRQMQKWLKDNSDGAFGSSDDVGKMDCIIKLFSVLDFLSKWVTEPTVNDMSFTPYGASARSVSGLYFGTGNGIGYMGDGFDVGRIHFKNGYSFVALKPDDSSTVKGLLADPAKLNDALIKTARGTEHAMQLNCKMPKFSTESEFNLIPTLSTLGLSDMFDERANFTKITENGEDDLYVEEMVSKVLIEVDEHGCKAKAMVRVAIGETSSAPKISSILDLTLDKPFVYMIAYDDIPLFIGTVTNP